METNVYLCACLSLFLLQMNIIFINNTLNFSISSFVYLYCEVHIMISSFAAQG